MLMIGARCSVGPNQSFIPVPLGSHSWTRSLLGLVLENGTWWALPCHPRPVLSCPPACGSCLSRPEAQWLCGNTLLGTATQPTPCPLSSHVAALDFETIL